MANAEYVRVSDSEKFYGQNNLLKSQLELLKIIRGFGNYKRQRSEEGGAGFLLDYKRG